MSVFLFTSSSVHSVFCYMSGEMRGKGRRTQARQDVVSPVSPKRSVESSVEGDMMMDEDRDEEASTSVRLHVMVKEPPKLTKLAAENLDDVLAWKESWELYFAEVKRVDVARATCEASVLKLYNLLLCSGPDSPPLRESDLARIPAVDFMQMLVTYLSPLAKMPVSEGLDLLVRMKGKAKLFIVYGKDEAYQGWSKTVSGIKECLVRIGNGIPNFEHVTDNVEMYNAFLDVFADARFKMRLKNLGKQEGCGNNAYKLWRVANKILYDSGVADTKLSVGHEILLHTMIQRGKRDMMSNGAAPKDKEVAGEATGAGERSRRKCWTCGSDAEGHDWSACGKRTDLTEAEKAAGLAAKKASRVRKNPK